MKHASSPESGNIVIYILGAIFLMGLLIMMVRGSAQPGSNVDAEALAIKVSEVQQYGNELERAVAFIMQNGHSERDIRFAHPNAHADYNSAGDINDTPSRQVFNKNGGGATWRSPPSGIQTAVTPWEFTGVTVAPYVGTTCSNATCVDLVAVLGNVTKDFCTQMNKSIGISGLSATPPVEEAGGVHVQQRFSGTYAYSSTYNLAPFNSSKEGCFEGAGSSPATTVSGNYYYYRVLLAR